eukprot:scaffold3930_cov116-Isochrysis_galbana.AAC.4
MAFRPFCFLCLDYRLSPARIPGSENASARAPVYERPNSSSAKRPVPSSKGSTAKAKGMSENGK